MLEKLKGVFATFKGTQTIAYVAEIILLATLIYFLINILLDNKAVRLLIIYVACTLVLGLCLLFTSVDNAGIAMLVFQGLFYLATVVLFSTEIKRTIAHGRLYESKHGSQRAQFNADVAIDEIIKAIQNMSKNDIGALIILSNGNLPSGVLESGVYMNADISAQLIESVFFPKSALHDGALILKGTRIQAAGCFLPLAQEFNLSKDLGSRHRAGIGLTENVNVTAIIVSEETGIISIAKGGKIIRYVDTSVLRTTLKEFYWQELIG